MLPRSSKRLLLADRNLELPEWAADDIRRNRFDRNEEELPRYAKIEANFEARATDIVQRFIAKGYTRYEAMRAMKRALFAAETKAFTAGKRVSGQSVYYITPAESRMLAGRHGRNMRYFSRFLRALETGNYQMPPLQRASLYAKSLWSLYQRGQAESMWDDVGPNARYEWVLDPDAQHCLDCLERWRESRERDGFTWDELIEVGFPGEKTSCGVRCRCHIRVIQKKTLQPNRIGKAEEQEDPNEGIALLQRILGGNDMPMPVPASGTPPVKVTPSKIARSILNASDGLEMAKKVPLAVKTLVNPDDVIESANEKTFLGNGLAVKIARNMDGVWELADVYKVDDDGLPQAASYNVPWKP